MTEFVFVTQPGNLRFFSKYYLWIPRYQYGQKPQRSCSDAVRKTFCRLFSLPLSSSRWEETNTQWNIGLLGGLFPKNPWFASALLLRAYPVALIFIQLYTSLREHDSTTFYSLGKNGVGCHSVNIHGSQQKDTTTAQNCPAMSASRNSWLGLQDCCQQAGQRGHWLIYLHLFTSCFRHL